MRRLIVAAGIALVLLATAGDLGLCTPPGFTAGLVLIVLGMKRENLG